MSIRACLCADTISYPEGGGHQWVYLNWALGLRALGIQVIWLELVNPHTPVQEMQGYVRVSPAGSSVALSWGTNKNSLSTQIQTGGASPVKATKN